MQMYSETKFGNKIYFTEKSKKKYIYILPKTCKKEIERPHSIGKNWHMVMKSKYFDPEI